MSKKFTKNVYTTWLKTFQMTVYCWTKIKWYMVNIWPSTIIAWTMNVIYYQKLFINHLRFFCQTYLIIVYESLLQLFISEHRISNIFLKIWIISFEVLKHSKAPIFNHKTLRKPCTGGLQFKHITRKVIKNVTETRLLNNYYLLKTSNVR